MKRLFIVLLIVLSGKGIAQNSTTYEIESLTPPAKFLYERPSIETYKFTTVKIEKCSQMPASLVTL